MGFLAKLLGRTVQHATLDLKDPLVRELSEEFRALDALPIDTQKDREEWHVARQAFEEKLNTVWSSVTHLLPPEIQHYLDDADIRAKDEGYTQRQRKKLAVLLSATPGKENPLPDGGG